MKSISLTSMDFGSGPIVHMCLGTEIYCLLPLFNNSNFNKMKPTGIYFCDNDATYFTKQLYSPHAEHQGHGWCYSNNNKSSEPI